MFEIDDCLCFLVERVECFEEEKKGILDDIKDVYGEMKVVGYDLKIVKQVICLCKMLFDDCCEMEVMFDFYKVVFGFDYFIMFLGVVVVCKVV